MEEYKQRATERFESKHSVPDEVFKVAVDIGAILHDEYECETVAFVNKFEVGIIIESGDFDTEDFYFVAERLNSKSTTIKFNEKERKILINSEHLN